MDMEIYIGLGALALFGVIYWFLNRPSLEQADDEINTILNSDEYKVKGRFEQ